MPTLDELMDQHKTPETTRRVARVILAGAEFGSPVFAPPGTPGERVKVLRAAHAKAMGDQELMAEAQKGRLVIAPSTREELEALTKEIMDQPPEVIGRVKNILGK